MHFLKEKTQEKLKELVKNEKFDNMFFNLRHNTSSSDEQIVSTLSEILSEELSLGEDKENILHYFIKLSFLAGKN